LNGLSYISANPAALTPFCAIDLRKRGNEYIIDYDGCLARLYPDQVNFNCFKRQIHQINYISKLNVYEPSFTLFTFTVSQKPSLELVRRVSDFLFSHSKSEAEAVKFLENGDTGYLASLRKFRPRELQDMIATFN
jgi:hypothetical protein